MSCQWLLHSTPQEKCPFPFPIEDEIYLPERVTHKIPGKEDAETVEGMHAVPKTGVCMWNVRGSALASTLQASD